MRDATLETALASLTQLSAAASRQMREEDSRDALHGYTLAQMQALKSGVDRTIAKLEAATEMDLGAFADMGLEDLLHETRTGSRMLAVGIATCKEFRGIRGGPIRLPQHLHLFCSADIINELPIEELEELLELCHNQTLAAKEPVTAVVCPQFIQYWRSNPTAYTTPVTKDEWPAKCQGGCGGCDHAGRCDFRMYAVRSVPCPTNPYGNCLVAGNTWPVRCPSCKKDHTGAPVPLKRSSGPEPTLSLPEAYLSATAGDDSAVSVAKLKVVCAAVASELEILQTSREDKAAERELKKELAADIESTVANVLVPSLKKHILRVGVGKGRVQPNELDALLSTCELSLAEEAHHDLDEIGDRVVAERTQRSMERSGKDQFDDVEYARGSLRSPRDRTAVTGARTRSATRFRPDA